VDGRYSLVLGHKEINPRPTDCPGNRFPLHWLHRTFPN
jgi:N-acetyl-anhydromuramyl-L-alanine amidase AmpD